MKRASGWRATARVIGTYATAAAMSFTSFSVAMATATGTCNFQGPATPFTIAPGQKTSFSLTMSCAPDTGEDATVTLSGLPTGSTYTQMVPVNTVNVTITIQTPTSAPAGGYTATLMATSNTCSAFYFNGTAPNLCLARFAISGPPVPVISGPGDLWWFNGVSPQPANYQTMLQVTGGTGPFKWALSDGSYAEFSNHSAAITTKTDTVEVLPKADPENANPPNLTVTVTATVSGSQATSDPFLLILDKPKRLFFDPEQNPDDQEITNKGSVGYSSFIIYQILDMYDLPMPNPVPVNERFGPLKKDDPKSNWVKPKQVGTATANPSSFRDAIEAVFPAPRFKPPSQRAQMPALGNFKVDHWSQTFAVGSETSGRGVEVQVDTFQRFQDHGRHCNIQSPPGTPGNVPNPAGC